jgi:hypothetical protein
MASTSYQAFETAIADAERLLVLFDKLPQQEQKPHEVLKRAALIMTLTAWETYIEALLLELVEKKIGGIQGSYAGDFILKKLHKEIKQLHNPTSDKVKHLSEEYLQRNLTEFWRWNNVEPEDARIQLNAWLSKRGDIVHHGRQNADPKVPHLVKRDEVEKAIKFFKELVKVTDSVPL